MKKRVLLLVILLSIASLAYAAMPDFGQDGLKGLSAEQKNKLASGEIVFAVSDISNKERSNLIEAALVLDKTPDETWNFLTHCENQYKYTENLEESRLVYRTDQQDAIAFKLKIAMMTLRFQTNHYFNKPDYFFHWKLDPTYKNDLSELTAYWRFYPYGQGKTLARYGARVSIKNVPAFFEGFFQKQGVERTLKAVRKYINSGGVYRKPNFQGNAS